MNETTRLVDKAPADGSLVGHSAHRAAGRPACEFGNAWGETTP